MAAMVQTLLGSPTRYGAVKSIEPGGTAVLHVYEAGGGVEFFVDQLASIQIDGVRQHTLAPNTLGGAEQSTLTRLRRSVRLALQMRSVIRDTRPHIVHLHGSFTSWFWLLAPNQRVVYTSHAWPSWKYGLSGSLWRLVAQIIGRGHTTYAALSRAELDEALRLGYRASSVRYIGSTVPFRSDRTHPETPALALFVGRPGFQKGSELLPTIADELAGEIPICAFGVDLGGAGFERVRGRKFDDLLNEAAVLIQPSRYEGLSLAALRAAVTGIPIVAFDSPGASWIEEFGAGILVATNDVGEFARAIRSVVSGEFVISDEDLQALRAHFSAGALARRLVDVYSPAVPAQLRGGARHLQIVAGEY